MTTETPSDQFRAVADAELPSAGPLIGMTCSLCGGTIMLVADLDGRELRCLQCARPARGPYEKAIQMLAGAGPKFKDLRLYRDVAELLLFHARLTGIEVPEGDSSSPDGLLELAAGKVRQFHRFILEHNHSEELDQTECATRACDRMLQWFANRPQPPLLVSGIAPNDGRGRA